MFRQGVCILAAARYLPAIATVRCIYLGKTPAMAKTTKAKAKGKKAVAKKAPVKREPAPAFMELSGTAPKADMTTGCYIRSLVMQGKHTTAKILELTKKHYPESTAKGADVSWNRMYLRDKGLEVPETIREKKADAGKQAEAAA
jgi:hypothetical protein